MTHSPVIVFLEIFQDGGLYPSFASTAVISSSRDHGDGLATFPGLTTVRIWEKVNVQVFNEVLIILKLFYFILFYLVLPCEKEKKKHTERQKVQAQAYVES